MPERAEKTSKENEGNELPTLRTAVRNCLRFFSKRSDDDRRSDFWNHQAVKQEEGEIFLSFDNVFGFLVVVALAIIFFKGSH